jgi:hypothetical protein
MAISDLTQAIVLNPQDALAYRFRDGSGRLSGP